MRIAIKILDQKFSEYMRFKSDGWCQRCKKFFGLKHLQTAHFHGRRKHIVRWDEDNVAVLCCGCHRHIDANPLEKIEFFMEKLGKERFEALNKKARSLEKVDKQYLLEIYKWKLKILKGD